MTIITIELIINHQCIVYDTTDRIASNQIYCTPGYCIAGFSRIRRICKVLPFSSLLTNFCPFYKYVTNFFLQACVAAYKIPQSSALSRPLLPQVNLLLALADNTDSVGVIDCGVIEGLPQMAYDQMVLCACFTCNSQH